MPASPNYQYLRDCALLVTSNFGPNLGSTLDLSQFRITFSVKRGTTQTLNQADIKVYNVSQATAIQLQSQFSNIILKAGYQGQSGVIFSGSIQQVIVGRESGTDTFVEFLAADGHLAYNYSFISIPLPAGTNLNNDITACAAVMSPNGVTTGGNSTVTTNQNRTRGKVLHGSAKKYLRNVAQSAGYNWSIQNEKIVMQPISGYLPGEAVILNQTNGMIGSPQQTLYGVNVKALLNPSFTVGTRVQLNNSTVQALAINLSQPATPQGIPLRLSTTDGIYCVQVVEHKGDTRGVDWYSTLTMYYLSATLDSANAVPVGGL